MRTHGRAHDTALVAWRPGGGQLPVGNRAGGSTGAPAASAVRTRSAGDQTVVGGPRGPEKILGNVVSGTTPLAPVVAIKYKVGAESDPREWAGGNEDNFVSRVSVFDAHCAAVYLTEKTDVAFRPFGLDLFDRLVRACKAVRTKLESEQRALGTNALTAVQATIPEATAVAKFLASVSSLTKPEAEQTLLAR